MSKVILALYLLAVVTFVASIDTEKFDSGNMTMTAVGASRGLRIKRGGVCWDAMRKACCKPKKNGKGYECKGDGCIAFMCWACC